MPAHTGSKLVIGRRERVDLPDWGVRRIRAKVDTGARTSAIHVNEIQELEDGRIRFEIVIRETPSRRTKWVTWELARQSVVKPSSGHRQERPVVRTRMLLDGLEWETDIGLVCRKGMLCRMLIGRLALGDRFLVDPAQKYIITPPRGGATGTGAIS